MSVSHIDFASFAAGLADSSAEIDWRMCAGRAYYAAFHRAQLSMHICPENDHLHYGSHARVVDRFMRHNTRKSKSVAYVLQAMKKVRSLADYEVDDNFSQSEAQNQFATYQVMVEKLNDFDASNGSLAARS